MLNSEKKSGAGIANIFIYTAALLIVIFGIYRVIDLIWVSDDVYITFRYVDNFIQGNGIVYNEGERVEGYTHFMWFVLLAVFRFMGFELPEISTALSIASYIGVILIFLLISNKLKENKGLFIPFTALALCLNYDFSIWATGGLETSFYTLLLSLVFYVYFFTNLSKDKRLVLAGFLLAVSCMTRPDASVFFILANSLLILEKLIEKISIKDLLKNLIYLNLTFILCFVPYLIWKYNYYGDIYPNTYYAKQAADSYWEQGFYYVWLFLKSYKSTFICLLGIVAAVKLLSSKKTGASGLANLFKDNTAASMLTALTASVVYLIFFVAKVGGDFMFARFIMPVLPLIYFTIEASVKKLFENSQKTVLFIFPAILVLIFFEKNFRDELFLSNENGKVTRINSSTTNGITDERLYYMSYWEQFPKAKNLADAMTIAGKSLHPYFKDLDVTVVIGGSRNYMGYYAQFKNIIIDNGLTDVYIAKLPLEARGRIGHEKYAPLNYLIEKKCVLGFYDKFRNNINEKPYCVAYLRIPELGIKMVIEIIYYDKQKLQAIKEKMKDNFTFIDMNLYLDDYINKAMKLKTKEQVRTDYKNLKEFYFTHNTDAREKVFLDYISE